MRSLKLIVNLVWDGRYQGDFDELLHVMYKFIVLEEKDWYFFEEKDLLLIKKNYL